MRSLNLTRTPCHVLKGTNRSPSLLASGSESSAPVSSAGQYAALAKTLGPYHLVVLGQQRGLAAYIRLCAASTVCHCPSLSSSPQYPTQDRYAITLSQLFLPTFAIAVSRLHPQLTVGTTRSRNHALYASLHSRARHVGPQFSDQFLLLSLRVFLSQQIERAVRTSVVNLSELVACHSTFWVNVTHKKNLKKALLQLRSG